MLELNMIHLGDCKEVLRGLPDSTVDSVVTDPPYGLRFMGKAWDYDIPSSETWAEVLRVLKPGGYLLSFGGPRTYHRMVCGIEDAGFEIRDQIMWLYGSGWPKSRAHLKPAHEPIVVARRPLSEPSITKNVLKWGTGGLNIDGCRVPHDVPVKHTDRTLPRFNGGQYNNGKLYKPKEDQGLASPDPKGRWPANVIHSGSDEVKAVLGAATKYFYCPKVSPSERAGCPHPTIKPLALITYLIRLVTPPGGLVLDPFIGSGTTAIAAVAEGFHYLGIEKDFDNWLMAMERSTANARDL